MLFMSGMSGMYRSLDAVILSKAKVEGRIVLTCDRDLAEETLSASERRKP